MQRLILALIIILYALLAFLYALFTPKWQAPDEPAHFNYIRVIADAGTLPILQSGDYDQAYLQKLKDARFPPSLPIDSIRYESYQPPLYYLAATPIYLLARGSGLAAQVLSVRLYSIALGVLLLLVAWNIVREIFPESRFRALATVGAIATVPQYIAISASISNDTAANLLLALILWFAIRRVNDQVTDRRFVILGGILFGAALLTKTTTYITGAVLLIGAEIARIKIHEPSFTLRAARFLPALFAISALVFSPWLIRGALTYGITDPLGIARHDSVVVGQPTTGDMISQYGLNHILFDYFAVTFKSFWAQFGWMGVLVNDRIYVVLMVLSGAAALGFVLWALRVLRDREMFTENQHWCIGLLIALLVTAFADYLAYNVKFFQLQGRYLFPAIIPLMFFFAMGLREITAREHRGIVFGIVYVGMVALDFASLFLYIIPQLRIAD
jgi:dolichyl-phosphate-mannose-protein mannosyltransferase